MINRSTKGTMDPFCCAPLRIKKALGIFGPGKTDSNKKKNLNTSLSINITQSNAVKWEYGKYPISKITKISKISHIFQNIAIFSTPVQFDIQFLFMSNSRLHHCEIFAICSYLQMSPSTKLRITAGTRSKFLPRDARSAKRDIVVVGRPSVRP